MDPKGQFCIVLTTVAGEKITDKKVSGEEGAENLASLILEKRLAACIQMTKIKSLYIWQGKVCSDPEYLLVIKTQLQKYAALEAFIIEHHPYETPEILQVPISNGSEGYFKWMGEI